MSTLYKSTFVHTIRVPSCPHFKIPPMSTLQGCAVTINAFIYFTPSFTHSPNLPFSEGICSPAAAILLLKRIERGKLCRGKLKCTAGATFKSPMTVEDLSVEITCLCRLLIYTDNGYHPNLGFNSSLQTMVFTLNLVSRNGNLHRQWV